MKTVNQDFINGLTKKQSVHGCKWPELRAAMLDLEEGQNLFVEDGAMQEHGYGEKTQPGSLMYSVNQSQGVSLQCRSFVEGFVISVA